MEYKKYRVKSIIKTFRDLEVYRNTTNLSADIVKLKFSEDKILLKEEKELLLKISKQIPKMIAESYGDKFTSLEGAVAKLEQSARFISDVISKIDFIMMIIGGKYGLNITVLY